MNRHSKPFRLVIACLTLAALGISEVALAEDPPKPITFRVKAGVRDRLHTPIRFEVPVDRFDKAVRMAVENGPTRLSMAGLGQASQLPKDGFILAPYPNSLIEARKVPDSNTILLTFVLDKEIPVNDESVFVILGLAPEVENSWSLDTSQPGFLQLDYSKKPVFRYNAAPVSSPNYGPIQHRDAYLHPAFSPSGALITGDFSSSHPHHRGFFLAYEKTKTGDLTPDFWNIHLGTGKIYSEGFDKPIVGPVTARFSAKHRWDAKDKAAGKSVTVLRERWDIEAYAIPDAPYWLFDVTSTQQAVDRPLELLPYRYGGMAYRGPEPFVKGTLDVLTSEGLNRKTGDQKSARWVDLTGPVADGSDQYAGAMIADHPSNPHYPNVARIHPTTLPFFCFVPAHDQPMTIAVDTPTVFRYRVLIHDGHPDRELDERVARDFAEPPVVVVE